MKATIYTEDGKVCRKVECEDVIPWNSVGMVILKGPDIRTNQPVVVSGDNDNLDWMLKGAVKFDLTLTIGSTQWKLKGAKCLIHYGNTKMVSFWHRGEWHTVVGQILVENLG